jgi:hypothetical protein
MARTPGAGRLVRQAVSDRRKFIVEIAVGNFCETPVDDRIKLLEHVDCCAGFRAAKLERGSLLPYLLPSWLFIDNVCAPRGDEERGRIPREAGERSVDVLIEIEVGADWIDFRGPGHHPSLVNYYQPRIPRMNPN